jgi:hypothetical protein
MNNAAHEEAWTPLEFAQLRLDLFIKRTEFEQKSRLIY